MYLSRKSLLPLALVVGLFGTATLAPAHAPGTPGGAMHLPAVQLATADGGIRRRRRVRGAKLRAILWWAIGRRRRAADRSDPALERLPAERSRHDWLARGPPRRPGA